MKKSVLETRQLSPDANELADMVRAELAGNPNVVELGKEPAAATPPVQGDGTPPAPPPNPLQTPHIEPKAGTPPPAPSFNPADFGFDETSGIKTIDDFKPIVEKGKKYDEVAQKYNQVQTEMQTLQEKLNQKFDVFASDEHAEFNAFAKETKNTNWDFFKTLKRSNITELPAIEKLILREQSMDVNNSLTKDQIREGIEASYGIEKIDYSYIDDDEQRARLEADNEKLIRGNTARLTMEANRAEKELLDLHSKIQKVDLKAQQAQLKEAQTQRTEVLSKEWEPHVDQVLGGMKKLPLEVLGEGNVLETVGEFDIPESDMNELKQRAMHYVLGSIGNSPTQEYLKQVAEVMRGMAFIKYQNQIISKVRNDSIANAKISAESAYSSPSGDKIPFVTDKPASSTKTVEEYNREVQEQSLKLVDTGRF
jgi:hypothetical protein